MKSTLGIVGTGALVVVAVFWLAKPTTATADFVAIGKNVFTVAAELGSTVTSWIGTIVSDIANHK